VVLSALAVARAQLERARLMNLTSFQGADEETSPIFVDDISSVGAIRLWRLMENTLDLLTLLEHFTHYGSWILPVL
jgi:hypothetical protein